MARKQATILLVDDDPGLLTIMTAVLERGRGFRTIACASPLEALERARDEAPDLTVSDVNMPEMSGIELTRTLRAEFPTMPVIVLTGQEDQATADAAYEAGATDFAVKPLDPLLLRARIEHALREAPAREAERRTARPPTQGEVLGAHPEVVALRAFIADVSAAPGAVALLLGESGTGKNLAARAIHAAAAEDGAPFVEINCAALPANLLEAELFGHEKGAFTDARQAKKGLVEVAEGGTLFLDEVGSLSLELQAKLLTFLESRRFRRVGGTTDRTVELRVVAATNADLAGEAEAGTFREDLYYRLNVATFTLPPLRRIRDDIPTFARHFVAMAAGYFRKPVPELDPATLEGLKAHSWPGNLRELRNVVERALIFHKGGPLRLPVPTQGERVADGPAPVEAGKGGPGAAAGVVLAPGLTLEEVERRYIQATLDAVGGQVAEAAELLGVTRKVLWSRRKKLGLLD